MNNIFFKIADVWNERLKELMNGDPKNRYTQQSLADAMNRKYAEQRGSYFTQKTVGRWTKVGRPDGPKKKLVGFPEYETMLCIADFFNVDVGYLTGETDSEKFDIKKASQFLHLPEETIAVVEAMTNQKTAFGATQGLWWTDASDAISTILSHPMFPEIIRAVRDLQRTWAKRPNGEHMRKLEAEIGSERLSAAEKADDFVPEADDPDGVLPPPTVQELDDLKKYHIAFDHDKYAYDDWILQNKVNKYMLTEVIASILAADYPIPKY